MSAPNVRQPPVRSLRSTLGPIPPVDPRSDRWVGKISSDFPQADPFGRPLVRSLRSTLGLIPPVDPRSDRWIGRILSDFPQADPFGRPPVRSLGWQDFVGFSASRSLWSTSWNGRNE